MNERYRYGYGDEPGDRDNTFSRQGSMTEQRDHPPDGTGADVEQGGRGDEEDEEQRADRIREAEADALAPAGTPAADRDQVATPTSSVFDVEEEAGEPDRPPAGERPAAAEPRAAEPASDSEERPPIALGPPARAAGEAPAAPVPAPLAEPPASTATPAGASPAAVSSSVQAPEDPAAATAGTETEMLVPGSAPAPADERSAVLASIDAVGIRARFMDIQAGFVDEPRQAVQEAERFVDELVHGLVQVLENERAKLKATIEDGSTEDLRIALRGYRAFVDRLLNLTM